MSVIRIPFPSKDLKVETVADTLEANLDRIEAELGPHATVHFIVESVPGSAEAATPQQHLIVEVRGQPWLSDSNGVILAVKELRPVPQ
jgi:hypothetical protein